MRVCLRTCYKVQEKVMSIKKLCWWWVEAILCSIRGICASKNEKVNRGRSNARETSDVSSLLKAMFLWGQRAWGGAQPAGYWSVQHDGSWAPLSLVIMLLVGGSHLARTHHLTLPYENKMAMATQPCIDGRMEGRMIELYLNAFRKAAVGAGSCCNGAP